MFSWIPHCGIFGKITEKSQFLCMIKGTAEYLTQGEIVEKFREMVETMFHGAASAKGALLITPEKVIVTTPGADNKKEL